MAIPGTPDALVSALEETKGRLAAALAALQQVTAERDDWHAAADSATALNKEAVAVIARLRAEGEAKDRALRMFVRIADVWPLLTPEQADDRIENAADAARTALARAATQENSNG